MLNTNDKIIVTGAAGFIASALVGHLNKLGFHQLYLVDDFSKSEKERNFKNKKYISLIDRSELEKWLTIHGDDIKGIYHLGARTDTTEFDYQILETLNLKYSQFLWRFCATKQIPFVYASSAATYGNGEHGYDDNTTIINQLKPLNPYGISKNEFDIWAVQQAQKPSFWAGLKFFNVYGPNEYHKGRMASVILHAFHQIHQNGGVVKLFRSHNPNYTDGGQLRDFIYVKDVVNVCTWLMEHQPASSLYNLGTGIARSFKDLALNVYDALGIAPNIEYVDTPIDIRDKYQYFTEANMNKLIAAGYDQPFYTLEAGIHDYVSKYLEGHIYM